MIIFSDSRVPIFNSRDPNRVGYLNHLKKTWVSVFSTVSRVNALSQIYRAVCQDAPTSDFCSSR